MADYAIANSTYAPASVSTAMSQKMSPGEQNDRISGCRFSVGGKASVDQRDLGVDRRMSQAFLKGNELDQFVGAFDVWRAILQRARRGSRTGQALRRSGVLFEGNRSDGLAPSFTQRSNTKL